MKHLSLLLPLLFSFAVPPLLWATPQLTGPRMRKEPIAKQAPVFKELPRTIERNGGDVLLVGFGAETVTPLYW